MAATEDLFSHYSEDDSNEDKENDCDEEEAGDGPDYLKYEDFTHTPLGLESYNDGLNHPVELRRILTGDLSNEMSVSIKQSPEDNFRKLSYPKTIKRPVSNIEDQTNSNNHFPKPPKLLKASFFQPSSVSNKDQSEDSMTSMFSSAFLTVNQRKPGRPSTASGSFDPETGAVRYSCRLHCGASLASAKGRRKHEKKHCPNMGKVAPPVLRGQKPTAFPVISVNDPRQNPLGFAHSLFGEFQSQQQNIQTKERKIYECRYCGKVLKTYEGRRLHEKLQHVAKQHQQLADEAASEDNKQLLIEHLKAAGMDPDCLEDTNHTIEYGDEEEDDEDEEDGEPSSDSLVAV